MWGQTYDSYVVIGFIAFLRQENFIEMDLCSITLHRIQNLPLSKPDEEGVVLLILLQIEAMKAFEVIHRHYEIELRLTKLALVFLQKSIK